MFDLAEGDLDDRVGYLLRTFWRINFEEYFVVLIVGYSNQVGLIE